MHNFDERMIALAASAALDSGMEAPDTLDAISEGGAFVIPVLVPTETETGDGRKFTGDALSTRNLPIPLLWQVQTSQGHDGSVIVGRIDSIDALPDGSYGNARGVFDVGPYGAEAERLVRGNFLRGVSADLDKFEANVQNEDSLPAESVAAADDTNPDDPAPTDIPTNAPDDSQGETIKSDKINVSAARITAATLVAKPAFEEAYIQMADDFEDPMEEMVPDGVYADTPDDIDTELAALAASAAPVAPPREWFTNPNLDEPTPLTVTDDGKVFGHIAAWHVQHIGLPNATRPPRSASRYAYFQTGVLRTAEGGDVPVGQLTLSGGHAPLRADASSAAKHYDDTGSAVADVCAGEDAYGIWVSGSLRPGATPEQVRALRASAPSGDWRPINGRLELVAVCQVNVPGFPVARAMVASGQVTALVAAGAKFMAELREEPMRALEERLRRVEVHTASELQKERDAAKTRLAALSADRSAALVASAQAARDRLRPIKEEREAALLASAEDARSRISALRVTPTFEEAKHPRADDGKFREILGRLQSTIGTIDGSNAVTDEVSKAADAADSGDANGAQKAGKNAKARLDDMLAAATDPATKARLQEAQSALESILSTAGGAIDNADKGNNGPVDAVISYLLNAIVSKADPTQAVRNAPEQVRRQLQGKAFTSTEELANYIQELIRRQVSPV